MARQRKRREHDDGDADAAARVQRRIDALLDERRQLLAELSAAHRASGEVARWLDQPGWNARVSADGYARVHRLSYRLGEVEAALERLGWHAGARSGRRGSIEDVQRAETARARLEKLRALAANPGTPGEGAAAQAAVERHVARHGRAR